MTTQTKQGTNIQIFEGVYNQQMPKLIKAGLKPLAVLEIVQARFNRELSFDIYYDAASGIAYAGEKQDKFKIIPFLEELASINPKTPLVQGGGMKLTSEEYEQIQANKFSRNDMPLNQRLTEQSALNHLGWLELFNKDKKLLEKYVQEVFKQVKDSYNESTAMSFYISDPQQTPNLRAVCLGRLYGRSGASDGYGFYGTARLVGIHESAEGLEEI